MLERWLAEQERQPTPVEPQSPEAANIPCARA